MLVVAGAALVVNVIASMSPAVARWWGGLGNTTGLPAPVDAFLEWRSGLSEADTHVVMWFVAGLAVVLTARHRGRRVQLAALLLAATAVIEFAQAAFTTRSAQWGDFVGGAIGLALALAIGELIARTARRPMVPATPHRPVG